MTAIPGGGGAAAFRTALAELGSLGVEEMPLGPLTTYRVGGAARVGVTVRRDEDLAAVAAAVIASALPVLVVGRGSNLLVADAGFEGIAVVLDPDAWATFEVDGPTVVAGAAMPLPLVARRSVEAGLTGFEWAVGVPGSVGGGVRMNAGGHGSAMATSLRSCTVVDLSAGLDAIPRRLGPVELAHGYRRSALRPTQVVTTAELVLAEGDPAAGRTTIREIVRWRREHQPGGQNAGSVFVNPLPSTDSTALPPGGDSAPRSAGWLIEATGLKGFRIGTAEVSPKHANFIQADPGGSADDVRAVMAAVAHQVEHRWAVALRTEIRLVGFPQVSTSSGGSLS